MCLLAGKGRGGVAEPCVPRSSEAVHGPMAKDRDAAVSLAPSAADGTEGQLADTWIGAVVSHQPKGNGHTSRSGDALQDGVVLLPADTPAARDEEAYILDLQSNGHSHAKGAMSNGHEHGAGSDAEPMLSLHPSTEAVPATDAWEAPPPAPSRCLPWTANLRPMLTFVLLAAVATYIFVHGANEGATRDSDRPGGGQDGSGPREESVPHQRRLPAGTVTAWSLEPPSCSFKDFVGLMECRHGYSDECCEGYRHFLAHQCVCAVDMWPEQWIPDDASPGGWMANLMKCHYSYAEIANYSSCLDQVRRPRGRRPPGPEHAERLPPSPQVYECNDAAEGDVRLNTYHKGELQVFAMGEWGTVCAGGFSMGAAHVVCRMFGYVRARHGARGDVGEPTQPVPCAGAGRVRLQLHPGRGPRPRQRGERRLPGGRGQPLDLCQGPGATRPPSRGLLPHRGPRGHLLRPFQPRGAGDVLHGGDAHRDVLESPRLRLRRHHGVRHCREKTKQSTRALNPVSRSRPPGRAAGGPLRRPAQLRACLVPCWQFERKC